jgi:hypothetical protein
LATVLLLIRCDTATSGMRALPCFGHTSPPYFTNPVSFKKARLD